MRSLKKKIYNHLLAFCCALISYSTEARTSTQELVAPEYLLHAGDRKILMEDIRLHGIPKVIWEKFIMSGDGNYDGLPAFRRGLYGVVPEDLTNISLYGLDQWIKGRENWVMILHLKPECRQKRFVVENYQVIHDEEVPVMDPFTLWLSGKGRKTLLSADTLKFCTQNGSEKFWEVGPFYGLNKTDDDRRRKSEICGGVVQAYFQETGAKIILDPMNGDYADASSWAIRDLSCIDRITGTPEDLFQGLIVGGLNRGVPADFFGAWEKPQNRPAVSLLLWVNILSEAPGFLQANWTKIIKDYKTRTSMQFADQLLGGFNENQTTLRNSQFEVVAYYLLEHSAECARKKKLADLQKLYGNFLDWYFGRVKICPERQEADPICHWGKQKTLQVGDETRPDLQDWEHVSSVLLLLREAKKLCSHE